MRISLLFFPLFAALAFIAAPATNAHPGNTDNLGGHTCYTNCEVYGLMHDEYHYHLDGGETLRTYDQNNSLFDQDLAQRLHGNILLQVDQHGEAWYVRSDTSKRYYMKDGEAAYDMMRSFGLGITDNDLQMIPAAGSTNDILASESVCSTSDTADRLRGEILLQVEQHGEAWYVHPETCLRIYMEDGEAAYTIMRFLGLGITDADLARIIPAELAIECGEDLACFKDAIAEGSEARATVTATLELFGITLTSTAEIHQLEQQEGLPYQLHRTIVDFSQTYTDETLDEFRADGIPEEDIIVLIEGLSDESKAHIGDTNTCTYDHIEDMLDQLDAWMIEEFSSDDMSFATCEDIE